MLNEFFNASASGSGSGPTYVDDVFSTFLYDGLATGLTVTNGLDLGGEGGLVWLKSRTNVASHALMSSDNNFAGWLATNNNNPRPNAVAHVTGNSDGFTLNNGGLFFNDNGQNYASWSFRKAPGFFDVVTWAGDSVSGKQIAHNLGSVPGFIMVKSYVQGTGGTGWMCYHRSLGRTRAIRMDNGTAVTPSSSVYWNNTDPTSTHFTVGNHEDINTSISGRNYVAYVFAHDSAVFGTDEDESIIKCGAYTGNGSPEGPTISLGFEPQWLMIKRSNNTGNWTIWDAMRGTGVPNETILEANETSLEDANAVYNVDFNPTGFQLKTSSATINGSDDTFIYVAIRRPHKPPTAGTEVFAPQASRSASNGTASQLHFTSNFPVDLLFQLCRAGDSANVITVDRMRGGQYLSTSSAAAEQSTIWKFDSQDGVYFASSTSATSDFGANMFRRAPGFFDVVAYTGTGATQSIAHNLEVAPELIICKKRSGGTNRDWIVGVEDLNQYLILQESGAGGGPNSFPFLFPSSPTSTAFPVSSSSFVNESTYSYISYLFATLPGISKIGTYSGTGNAINVDCGFSTGARFILIKRTDSTGDWYGYDTARGIVSGNDPYLLLNSTAAEVTNTDYIDPLSSGFIVTSSAPASLNASGGNYLFLAIA